jgi:hypothetical protein
MADEVALKALPATPITYRFVSVHRIVGFSDLRTTPALQAAREIPLNLGIAGVSATLIVDPNAALSEVDRAAALAHLLLLGFAGQRAPGDVLNAVHEQAAVYAQERLKKFGAPGVYLVLEARGELISTPTEVARDLDGALFAFDAVDKTAIKARYAPLVSAALAAVALSVDTTTDVANVADGISFTLPDGRQLYSVTMTVGSASLTTARPATDKDARAIEMAMAALIGDERLATPAQLLVDALRSTADRLEAFLFAWAGLEMVVRKCTVGCERGEWVLTVPEAFRTIASALHEGFRDGGHPHYSLAQKSRMFALSHRMGSGEDLGAEITRIRRAYREPLYHEGSIADRLPVEALVLLLRKVIAAALNSD